MSNRLSQDDLPTRSTTNTQTFLETCVLDADHKALKEHLVNNQVGQSDLDRCLMRRLRIVQLDGRALSYVAPVLTLLLQSGAKWNSDAMLAEQKTPYHIICESGGDHHELLDLMIKSCQQTIIDAQDIHRRTALVCAVENANINCVKCLIANTANLKIRSERYSENLTPIMKAIWMLSCASKYSSVILADIFDLLLDAAVEQNKQHFKNCTDYILHALHYGNVNCIKKLINIGAPLDVIDGDGFYVWELVATMGDVGLLKGMFNRGIDKNAKSQKDVSVLFWVVTSGNIEAIRYLLGLGVVIPTYSSTVVETKYRLIIDDNRNPEGRDPCLKAICENKLEIVKLLDEYGSQSCKSFTALRCALKCGNVDVVSYLLNKHTYPLNIEYFTNYSGKLTFTLLSDLMFDSSAQITKLLLDHGADPTKPMCPATGVSAIMAAIEYGNMNAIAQYIRTGVDINFRSCISEYKTILPFEASVQRHQHYISLMLLISGCSRGGFSPRNFRANPNPDLEKLMREWNVYENNVTPLMQRCRCVILNHLSPRADVKIGKLPLPQCLTKFMGVPELDNILYEHNKADTD